MDTSSAAVVPETTVQALIEWAVKGFTCPYEIVSPEALLNGLRTLNRMGYRGSLDDAIKPNHLSWLRKAFIIELGNQYGFYPPLVPERQTLGKPPFRRRFPK